MQATLLMFGVCLTAMIVPSGLAQAAPQGDAKTSVTSAEQEHHHALERQVALDGRAQRRGPGQALRARGGLRAHGRHDVEGPGARGHQERRIQYKDAQIQEVSVRFVGGTAILLNRIRLVAVVGGNEVVNPFNVTEVYVKVDGAWKLASISFTRLLTPQ